MSDFWFVLPETFRAGEFLRTAKFVTRFDDALYFIHLILTKTARWEVDTDGWVRLHAKHLRNIMHKTYYSAIVDSLLDGGAVRRAPYRPGEKSFGYKLAERYISDKHVRIPVTDSRLIGRLETFHEKTETERRARMKPVHIALDNLQHKLRIHGDLARDIVAALPVESNPYDMQGIIVSDIERGNYHSNVGRYGRLTNNITSMKREIRPSLHVHGSKLLSVDLSCCQPALIAQAYDRYTEGATKGTDRITEGRKGTTARGKLYDARLGQPVSGDFEQYRRLVQSGEFYDFMVAELPDHDITREKFKKRFLADVVAKRKANRRGDEYPSVVEDKFRELFPNVYRFIRRINRDGWEHENLIRELQRLESRLVIETIAESLVTRHPKTFFITLHDSIYSVEADLQKVQVAFDRAFDQFGFHMTTKVAA